MPKINITTLYRVVIMTIVICLVFVIHCLVRFTYILLSGFREKKFQLFLNPSKTPTPNNPHSLVFHSTQGFGPIFTCEESFTIRILFPILKGFSFTITICYSLCFCTLISIRILFPIFVSISI